MGTGEVIAKLIEARGISVRELARRLKAIHGKDAPSGPTIGRWINSQGDPRLSELRAVAEFFGVTLASLVDGAETEKSLPDDERGVLKLYRALEIDESEALRRLSGEGRRSKPASPSEKPVPFAHGNTTVPGAPPSRGKGVS